MTAAEREAMILSNRGLVGFAARRYNLPGADADDLFQIGAIGLIKAVDSYDAGRGVKLASYALRCIDNEILMALRVSQRRRREVSLDSPLLEDANSGKALTLADKLITESDTVFEAVRRQMRNEALHKALEVLSERERAIIVGHYDLDGQGAVNQAELARRIGISQGYVSRLERHALHILKAYLTETGTVEQTA